MRRPAERSAPAAGVGVRDWLTLVEAGLTLVAVVVAVRCLPYRCWKGELARAAAPAGGPLPGGGHPGQRILAARVGRLFFAVAGRLSPPATCLHRALALRRLLARRGVPATLRIGFPADGPAGAAHAWLEAAGTRYGDSPAHPDRPRFRGAAET